MTSDRVSSEPPRALLFDVMGTLVYDPFYVEVPAFFGMELGELLEAKHPTLWAEFERGEVEESAFLRGFFLDERTYDHSAFRERMLSSYAWIEGMEGLLAKLNGCGHRMHALSNYSCWYELIEEKLGLSRFLDWSFVSCHTGFRKPEARAFLHAAESLHLLPGQCLLVDDRAENCEAAEALGMQAIRFTDAAKLADELASRGLLA